jgi:hypothetical protein
VKTRLALPLGATALALLAATALSGPAVQADVVVPTPLVGTPTYTVHVDDPTGDEGYVFYTTGLSGASFLPAEVGAALAPLTPSSLVIRKKTGEVVWQRTAPTGEGYNDFRTQTYRGKKVLTWWEGAGEGGHGAGADYIADTHGNVIKKITLPGGYDADIHEFRLVSGGRALITSYQERTGDLSSIGGAKNGSYYDSIAFVVDVATGKVLQKWDAAEHIPVGDTTYTQPLPPNDPTDPVVWDPFHINSIDLDAKGNLLMSFRNLSAVYDVAMKSGRVDWVLGGTHPTLTSGPGVSFGFQHDAELVDAHTLQLFNDNASGPAKADGYSSVERIRIDPAARTATLVSNWTHPDKITAWAMGNAQAIPHGHTFVGWGTAPRISEFDAHGHLVYDASLPTGSYRAFLDTL